jgi:hypothetical protein
VHLVAPDEFTQVLTYDCPFLALTHSTLKLLRSDGISVLIDLDGYSHNGMRGPAVGLFPQTPAPVQIALQVKIECPRFTQSLQNVNILLFFDSFLLLQEFIGTVGADDFIQYIVTDEVASPAQYQDHFSEKVINISILFLKSSK